MQPERKKALEYTPDPNKFDLRTHHWNGQGELMKKNLYTCHVVEGRSYYERPINSGNLWFENNQPAGRVEYKDGVKHIKAGEPHIDYTTPLEGAEKLHFELEAQRSRTAELEAELAAIKGEREPKVVAQAEAAAPSLKAKGKV